MCTSVHAEKENNSNNKEEEEMGRGSLRSSQTPNAKNKPCRPHTQCHGTQLPNKPKHHATSQPPHSTPLHTHHPCSQLRKHNALYILAPLLPSNPNPRPQPRQPNPTPTTYIATEPNRKAPNRSDSDIPDKHAASLRPALSTYLTLPSEQVLSARPHAHSTIAC